MTPALFEIRVARWAFPAVMAIGIVLSTSVGMLADRHINEKASDRLNALADLAASNITEHVAHIAGLTRALQASFLNLPDMPAEEFRGFVDILRLHAGTQPIQSYLFAERRNDDLFIRHAEPAAGNKLTGLRLLANPATAEAIRRLRTEGALMATVPFALEQTDADARSLVFLAPIHLSETQPSRYILKEGRLAGVVAIMVSLDGMLAPLAAQLREQQVRLRISSLPTGRDGKLAMPDFFSDEDALAGSVRHTTQRNIDVQGTQWLLTLEAGPGLLMFPQRDLALIAPAVLLTLTLLLAALAHTLVRSRRLAERHAEMATRDLRQSEARFRDLTELSSDWYWEQDSQFRFTHMSVGVYNKSGVAALSTIGKTRWELPIEGVSEADWAAHRALLERHEPFRDFAYRMRAPDGSLRWFVISGRPVFMPDGQFAGYRGTGKDITEQKASEMALRESEERYRLLFDLSPDAILVLQERTVVLANRAAFALHRAASPQALVGRPFRNLILPEDWPLKESRLALLESGAETMLPLMERRYLTADGKDIIDVETAAVRITLNGRPAIMSVARDISERKRAEIQLQLAATVFENSREGVTITDADQNIISVNRAFTEITGYAEEEVLGRNPSLLQSGRQNRAFYEAMWKGIVHDGYWSGEIWNRRKNGEIYPELLSITAVRDDAGKTLHYTGVFTDITERRRAEDAVQHERQLLEAVMDALPVGVWLMDGQGRISRSNPAAIRIWAGARYVDVEQFGEYKAWWADSGREIRPEEWAAARAFSKGETSINEKIVIQCFDGSRKTILNSALPLRDDQDRIIGAVIVNQDIDALERAQQEIRQLNEGLERRVRERTAELEASNRELEAFSYSVSHDLRAPLRSIDGFAHILAEDYGSRLDDAGRSHLERIRKASQRLSQTIDDMIELARITRMPLHRREVDLSSLARTVLLELSQHSRHRPEIVIAEAVTVQADPALLRIVLENLLDNARKFTSRTEPARIEFGTREIDGERAYFVRDNGAGFDPAYADKLFQPFQRLHRPDEFAGTGIGLATVQRIVQRHGGRIWAEGAAGQGAAFYFTLP